MCVCAIVYIWLCVRSKWSVRQCLSCVVLELIRFRCGHNNEVSNVVFITKYRVRGVAKRPPVCHGTKNNNIDAQVVVDRKLTHVFVYLWALEVAYECVYVYICLCVFACVWRPASRQTKDFEFLFCTISAPASACRQRLLEGASYPFLAYLVLVGTLWLLRIRFVLGCLVCFVYLCCFCFESTSIDLSLAPVGIYLFFFSIFCCRDFVFCPLFQVFFFFELLTHNPFSVVCFPLSFIDFVCLFSYLAIFTLCA